jgi:hypothetical protein
MTDNPIKGAIMYAIVETSQFSVTAEGIAHKPTGAKFLPYAGERYTGKFCLGQSGNVLENGDEYRENEVREMMFDLWVQFNSESVEQ